MGLGSAGRRIDAVKRGTRPRQVEMCRVAEKNSGRIGERSRNAGIEGAKFAKHLHLHGIERVVGNLGASKVAHQQRDAVISSLHARRKRRRLLRGDAEAVHAGIDMQRRAALPVARGDECVPFGKFGHRVDHRPRVEFDEGLRRIAA